MIYLYPIWLFFTAFFFYFSYVNWRQSAEGLRPFVIRDSGSDGEASAELESANTEFARQFNLYLAGLNKHNRARHRTAAIGYFVAGLTSLFSMFMLLIA